MPSMNTFLASCGTEYLSTGSLTIMLRGGFCWQRQWSSNCLLRVYSPSEVIAVNYICDLKYDSESTNATVLRSCRGHPENSPRLCRVRRRKSHLGLDQNTPAGYEDADESMVVRRQVRRQLSIGIVNWCGYAVPRTTPWSMLGSGQVGVLETLSRGDEIAKQIASGPPSCRQLAY